MRLSHESSPRTGVDAARFDAPFDVLGGLGVSKEMPLERWYRELRIKRIGEGPSEVHRMVVARQLLKNPLTMQGRHRV